MTYQSTRDAYGRRTEVEIVTGACEICDALTKVMTVDSSEGEYLTFVCCRPCIVNLFEKELCK